MSTMDEPGAAPGTHVGADRAPPGPADRAPPDPATPSPREPAARGPLAGRDLAPSEATTKQWQDRRRRRRLTTAGRLGAPLAAICLMEAVVGHAHGGWTHRAALALRPALVIVVVAVPLGWMAVLLATAAVRRRDRRRPAQPGEVYVGTAVLHAAPTAGQGGSRPVDRVSHWGLGELRLIAGQPDGGLRLRWTPGEGSRSRGFQPVATAAINLARCELEIDRPHYGYARFGIGPDTQVGFGVMDMARLVAALIHAPGDRRTSAG